MWPVVSAEMPCCCGTELLHSLSSALAGSSGSPDDSTENLFRKGSGVVVGASRFASKRTSFLTGVQRLGVDALAPAPGSSLRCVLACGN